MSENDRALRRTVIEDGHQDLLGAYQMLGLECANVGHGHSVDLDTLRRIQAAMALVIYAALKATSMEEMSPEMQHAAREIQRIGLTRFVCDGGVKK